MNSNSLIVILLIGLASFIFFKLFGAKARTGNQRLAGRRENHPRKRPTSKRPNANSNAAKTHPHAESDAVSKPAGRKVKKPARTRKKDDLTRIEGIGPRVAQVLSEAGIRTYSQLATSDLAVLEATVIAGGMRFNRSIAETWPQQARFAETEQWEPLNALQASLKSRKKSKG